MAPKAPKVFAPARENVLEAIARAINIGGQLYSSDPNGCLLVYMDVARRCQGNPGGFNPRNPAGRLLTQALNAITYMDQCQSVSHAKTYLIRQAFEEVIDAGEDVDGSLSEAVALADSPGVWTSNPDRVVWGYETAARQSTHPRVARVWQMYKARMSLTQAKAWLMRQCFDCVLDTSNSANAASPIDIQFRPICMLTKQQCQVVKCLHKHAVVT